MPLRRLLTLIVAPVAALGIAAGCASGSGSDAGPNRAAGEGTAASRTTSPPWNAPDNPDSAVQAAGLRMLDAEGTALHIHAHLDVRVDGKAVTVPAGVGIDEANQRISPLHTHDTSGVLHVESPDKNASFTLGQFFTEWQVRLNSSCVGGLCSDGTHTLRAYVNGTPYQGDPADITLAAHQEIELVYGDASAPVTPIDSYDFAPGL